MITPDIPVTPLAFRSFALDFSSLTLGSVTAMGGKNRLPKDKERLTAWMNNAIENDDTPGGWARDDFTTAVCNAPGAPPMEMQLAAIAARSAEQPYDFMQDMDDKSPREREGRLAWIEEHTHTDGPDGAPTVASPGPECKSSGGHGCGLYAATDMTVLNGYLTVNAPVMAVIETGGRVLDCAQGYRAEQMQVAAILLLDEVLLASFGKKVTRGLLERVAAAYEVPALVPHSVVAAEYRDKIAEATVFTDDDIERFFDSQG